MWPVLQFWGQFDAQADEHKEDIYAGKQHISIIKTDLKAI
jgi:hypothetical protein